MDSQYSKWRAKNSTKMRPQLLIFSKNVIMKTLKTKIYKSIIFLPMLILIACRGNGEDGNGGTQEQ